ncbi:MAG: SemiSWEET transporter [Lysobacter sp.]|nr:SemiSWEET transporter [Lysobacter sp.]
MNGEWLGYMAAVLTTLSFVPQAIKTIRSRDTSGISISMYVLFTVGVGFWLAYGIALGSWPMIGCNLVTLLLAGTILCLKIRYR